MTKWTVPQIWQDSECFIIGGGPSMPHQFGIPKRVINRVQNGASPSLYADYMDCIKNRHIIGVNKAYELGNFIDVLFFGDCSFYKSRRKELANYPALKITSCPQFGKKNKQQREGIKYLARDHKKRYGITNSRSKVSWNCNSGAAAISVASNFGVKKIYLLGFDNKKVNEYGHWHKGYGTKPKNQKIPFARHRRGYKNIAQDAKKKNIDIVNLNPDSNIDVFPKFNLKDILDA